MSLLNSKKEDYKKTSPVIVIKEPTTDTRSPGIFATGFCRGGTTMIAKVLSALDVHMHYGNIVMDDDEIHKALGNPEERKRIITERDSENKLWGFKYPMGLLHSIDVLDYIKNPRFLVVTRDPSAILGRAYIINSDMDKSLFFMESALKSYMIACEYARNPKVPTAFVSYEKASVYPEETVKGIVKFIGINPGKNKINAAVEAIMPHVGY